jgi:hypothetical protein
MYEDEYHLSTPEAKPSAEKYGPFRADRDPVERRCQLRSMGTVAHMLFGVNCELVRFLRAAEDGDAVALSRAYDAVEALAPLHRRRLLATFSAVTWPHAPRGGRS